ncbi:LCP family protein [Streptomyces sp. NPDC006879]|uniref:LCP family protein n=1 Tax=Streptomyces sp. NPDC006879 TaxID=3364767 RepID=UPI0036B8B485
MGSASRPHNRVRAAEPSGGARTGQRAGTTGSPGGCVTQSSVRGIPGAGRRIGVPAPVTPGGTGAPGGPRRRGRRRALRWIAAVLSLLILGTAGAGYLYFRHLNDAIQAEPLNLGDHKVARSQPNAFGLTPLNILLIGSDARDSKANQDLGGARETFGGTPLADVQMLLHLSADRSNMSVISMPRDTLIKLPKCTDAEGTVYPATTGVHLTNETLGRGGPGCTVAAWNEVTGIPIDHFMMVDFAGVVAMADAIGGVPVCVRQNINSRTADGKGSGLKLPAGQSVIQGEQALQWLRTRYGFEDGTDLARTHAQHMYMNSMAREFRKNAKLSNPVKLHSLAQAAIRAMVVDTGLNRIDKLFDLAMELKKIPTSRITMTTMPWVYSQRPGLTGKVEPKPGDAEALFAMVREDLPLDGKGPAAEQPTPTATATGAPDPTASATAGGDPVPPIDEIAVMVRNATGGTGAAAQGPHDGEVRGRATAVMGLLHEKGFATARVDGQQAAEDTTVLRYAGLDQEGDARAVAKSLGLPPSAVQRSTDVSGVTLFVGADWREGSAPSPRVPLPSKAPDSSRPLNGADDQACMDVQAGFTW